MSTKADLDPSVQLNRSTKLAGPMRYRVYYWLMDLCLFFGLVGLTDFILDRTVGIEFFGLPEVFHAAIALPTVFFNFAVAFFLMVARFMRDEYSEQLWRRAVVFLAYFGAVAPPAIFVASWIIYVATAGISDAAELEPTRAPWYLRWIITEVDWGDALYTLWAIYMLVFVGCFQFLRWRDSRSASE